MYVSGNFYDKASVIKYKSKFFYIDDNVTNDLTNIDYEFINHKN